MKKIVNVLVVVFMLLVMCPIEKIHADYIFVQPDEFEEISEGSVLTFGDHSFTFNGLELLEDKNEVKASFTYDTKSPIYNYHVYDLAIFVWRDYALYFEQKGTYFDLQGVNHGVYSYAFDKDYYNLEYFYFYMAGYTSLGRYDSKYIKVKNPYYVDEVQSIWLEQNERLYVGNSILLDGGFIPNNTPDEKILTWTSSDERIATVDSDGWVTGVGVGSCTITVSMPNGASGSCVVNVSSGALARLYGSNRYTTSFMTASMLREELKVEKFANVIVSSGKNFADALAGSYLAAKKDAPILMVDNNTMKFVCEYIGSYLRDGGNVYILGGTSAVSGSFESMVTKYGNFNVKRLAGNNRYDTNLEILKEASVTTEDVLVCTGTNFADSLSASAAGRPLLLVGNSLNADQLAFLQGLNGNKLYIIGGTGAVNESVEATLRKYGNVKRIAGNSRYDTSVEVAKTFFTNPTRAVVAYGKNFPDGLSGGPLAYAIDAPLLLTENKAIPTTNAYTVSQGITSGYVLGGSGLISNGAAKNALNALKNDELLEYKFDYDRGNVMVSKALSLLGTPGPCSQLVEYSLNAVGLTAWKDIYEPDPSTGEDKYVATMLSPETCKEMGERVYYPLPGDIAYYVDGGLGESHVGLYIGNGMCVHGNYNGKTTLYKAKLPGATSPEYYRVKIK